MFEFEASGGVLHFGGHTFDQCFLVLLGHGFVGLGAALAIYSYEADIVALLISADDDYSLFPPNITCMVNREVIGIVTKVDKASPERAESWLKLSGCEKIFYVNSKTGEGVQELKAYLQRQI